jgi:hypothetical protein
MSTASSNIKKFLFISKIFIKFLCVNIKYILFILEVFLIKKVGYRANASGSYHGIVLAGHDDILLMY